MHYSRQAKRSTDHKRADELADPNAYVPNTILYLQELAEYYKVPSLKKHMYELKK